MQAVVGSNIAKYNSLEIGDVIYTSHSASETDLHTQGLMVVGILEKSHSSYDNIVFTQIKTLWDMHDHGDHEDEEEGEEHLAQRTVCAVLVSAKNPAMPCSLWKNTTEK